MKLLYAFVAVVAVALVAVSYLSDGTTGYSTYEFAGRTRPSISTPTQLPTQMPTRTVEKTYNVQPAEPTTVYYEDNYDETYEISRLKNQICTIAALLPQTEEIKQIELENYC
ncbi:hypothetical protein KY329_03605 [Candidatus Woesearchaeota archaeon]|nr:hypothetical protein [Candidatus Woesearchaeota archaeon]